MLLNCLRINILRNLVEGGDVLQLPLRRLQFKNISPSNQVPQNTNEDISATNQVNTTPHTIMNCQQNREAAQSIEHNMDNIIHVDRKKKIKD